MAMFDQMVIFGQKWPTEWKTVRNDQRYLTEFENECYGQKWSTMWINDQIANKMADQGQK